LNSFIGINLTIDSGNHLSARHVKTREYSPLAQSVLDDGNYDQVHS